MRTQYVYIEVKASSKCVTLYGPQLAISDIARINFNGPARCETALLGNSMKIVLLGEDLLFMKAALLDEVLGLGFKLLSSINDDLITLFREVKSFY